MSIPKLQGSSPLVRLLILLCLSYTVKTYSQDLHEYLGQDELFVTSRLGEPQIRHKDHISYTDYKHAWHFYYKRQGSSVFNRIELIVFANSKTDAQNKWISLSDEFTKQYGFSPVDIDVEKHICTLQKDKKSAEITIKTNPEKTVYAVRADLRIIDTEPVPANYSEFINKISRELSQFRKYIGNSAEDIFSERGTPDNYGNHMATYENDQFSYEFLYDRGIVRQCSLTFKLKSKSEASGIYSGMNKILESTGSSKFKSSRVKEYDGYWTDWKKKAELVNTHYYKIKDGWLIGIRVIDQN